jgi:hypothetical protein
MVNKSSSKANQTKTNRIAFLFGAGADPICYYGDAFTKEFLYKQRLSIRNMIIEQLHEYSGHIYSTSPALGNHLSA